MAELKKVFFFHLSHILSDFLSFSFGFSVDVFFLNFPFFNFRKMD